MKDNQYSVTMVNVVDLKPSKYNPSARTEPRNLKSLRDSIVKAGRIIVPIFVTKDFEIIDGHRRVAVAIDLGIEKVPAMIGDANDKESLWGWINTGSRATSPAEWMQAYQNGYPPAFIPDTTRNRILELERICGDDLFASLCDKGKSPAIMTMVRRVASYCDDRDENFMRKVIVWFDTHHQQFSARRFMDADHPANILRQAVTKNKPLVFKWEVDKE